MSAPSVAPSLIVFVCAGQVECVSNTPLQVALLDQDTDGVAAEDLVQLRSLKNRPSRWEEVQVDQKPKWVSGIYAATPPEEVPEAAEGATAKQVILSMRGGAIETCQTDGAVRIMVLDRDPHDPDDLLTFPGERFNEGQTFEAAREWPETSIVPVRVVEAFEEVARLSAPRSPAARRRPAGP